MNKLKFKSYIDMLNISDSVLLNSGTTIASLIVPSGETASIEVRGSVKITYKNKDYYSPEEFPQELKSLIQNNKKWYLKKEISVSDNNWFEFFYNANAIIPLCCECVNCENKTVPQIYEIMANLINQTEEYQCVPSTYDDYLKETEDKER